MNSTDIRPRTRYEIADLIDRLAQARAWEMLGMKLSSGAIPTVDEWRETIYRSIIMDLLTAAMEEYPGLNFDYYVGSWARELEEALSKSKGAAA